MLEAPQAPVSKIIYRYFLEQQFIGKQLMYTIRIDEQQIKL